MAHSLSAQKRIRQNAKRKARNRWRTRTMKEAVKAFLHTVSHGSAKEAETAFRKVSQIIDRTAQKGVIHRNQASRRKSRLSKRLKAMASGTKAAAAPAKTAGTTKSKAKA